MKLYIVVYDEGVPGQKSVTFVGTQADQKALEKSVHAAGNEVVRSEAVEVPTDKEGLLTWLNTFKIGGVV